MRRLLGLLIVSVLMSACGSSVIAGRCVPSLTSRYQECSYTTLPPAVPRPTLPTTTSPPPTTAPSYTLAADPVSREVTHGGSTTYTVTVEGNTNFNEEAVLAVSGLPAQATGTFSPAAIGSGQSSVLTVQTSRGASKTGNYTLTISGETPTGMYRDTKVTLIVTK